MRHSSNRFLKGKTLRLPITWSQSGTIPWLIQNKRDTCFTAWDLSAVNGKYTRQLTQISWTTSSLLDKELIETSGSCNQSRKTHVNKLSATVPIILSTMINFIYFSFCGFKTTWKIRHTIFSYYFQIHKLIHDLLQNCETYHNGISL